MSAAGHVDAGESYEEAAARELKEELCIEGPLTFLRKEFYTEDPRKTDKFISAYLLRYNGDFDFNPREVDTVQWVSLTELEKMTLSGEPFHPQFPFMFDRVRNQLDI